jgi:hypothetical protein
MLACRASKAARIMPLLIHACLYVGYLTSSVTTVEPHRVKGNVHFTTLNIPKGQSEAAYRRRTENTMVKRKSPKGQTLSTKHTHKTKDRVTRTLLNTGGELRCSGRVISSCSTSGTRRVNLVTHPVISHEWGKDREVFTTSGTYPWSFQ